MKPKEPWWIEYRRQRFKVRQTSIEMILRKSLQDTAKEYMRNSSLACVPQITNLRVPPRHRLVLLVTFCILLGVTCYFLCYTISNTLTKPLIVTMESSTYPISNIDFPAVALCNINRISKKALRAYARSIYQYVALHNETFQELEWWLYNYGRLLDFSFTESLEVHPFMDIRSKYHINTSVVNRIMKKFAPKCDEMLLKCFWSATQYNCSDLFQVRRTFRGHCCVFNYVLDFNAGGKAVNTIAKVKRQVEPGPIHGLLLTIDPMLLDYGYPLRNVEGFDVFLFDTLVYPDPYVGRVVHRVLEPDKAMYIELQSVKQMAASEVRKYPRTTRNCMFHDESSMFGNMYSYAECLISCRIKSVQSLYKCTPYFLPTDIHVTELCTLENQRCVNKYKEKLLYIYPQTQDTEGLEMEMQDSLFCPHCLPDCEFTKHFTRVYKTPLIIDTQYHDKEFQRILYGNLDRRNKSILSIYQSTSDGTLDRLDVVSYWFEVISNFGGFAGVLIGFSMVSITEIIYFFCIRFFQQFYLNYKLYR